MIVNDIVNIDDNDIFIFNWKDGDIKDVILFLLNSDRKTNHSFTYDSIIKCVKKIVTILITHPIRYQYWHFRCLLSVLLLNISKGIGLIPLLSAILIIFCILSLWDCLRILLNLKLLTCLKSLMILLLDFWPTFRKKVTGIHVLMKILWRSLLLQLLTLKNQSQLLEWEIRWHNQTSWMYFGLYGGSHLKEAKVLIKLKLIWSISLFL